PGIMHAASSARERGHDQLEQADQKPPRQLSARTSLHAGARPKMARQASRSQQKHVLRPDSARHARRPPGCASQRYEFFLACGGCAGIATTLACTQNEKTRETTMRYGLFMTAGLMMLAAPAQAEPRSAYVTMVLQAFAVKVE